MILGRRFFVRGGDGRHFADAGKGPAPCRSGCGREDARRRAEGGNAFFLRCDTGVRGSLVFPDFFLPGDRAPAGRAVDGPARRFCVPFIYFFLVFLFAPFFEFC